jgi:MSHA biogenesis protein MshK
MKRALFCAMMMATVVATAGARAQALTDPTRPPSALSALSASQAAEEPAGTQLQSILMSSGRKVAVINGTMVPLGGMFGESRVVRITETQVVLKRGEETEVLTMYPGIDKRAVKRSAARRGESK